MKKISSLIYIVFVIIVTIGLVGCRKKNNNENNDDSNEDEIITNVYITPNKSISLYDEEVKISLSHNEGGELYYDQYGNMRGLNFLRYYIDIVNDNAGAILSSSCIEIKENSEVTLKAKKAGIVELRCGIAFRDYKFDENSVIYSDTIKIEFTNHFISTVDELQNIDANKNYTLKNDINCENYDFTTINVFNGILDGHGYSINNLKINSEDDYVGLFGTLNGEVSNIVFNNINISAGRNTKYVGTVAGCSKGIIDNITVNSGEIKAEKSDYVGGVVGYVSMKTDAKVKNMHNSASISGASYVGGIYGYIGSKNLEIRDSDNKGDVQGTGNYVGGIFGSADGKILDYEKVENTGDISGYNYVGGITGYATMTVNAYEVNNSSKIKGNAYVGGLFGQIGYNTGHDAGAYSYIEKCTNEGSVIECTGYDGTSTKTACVGGFVGCAYHFYAIDVNNKSDIIYENEGRFVGGIAGYVTVWKNSKISNLSNEGNISGASYVGGIYGYITSYIEFSNGYSSTYDLEIKNYNNKGSINGTGDYVGGIFGYILGNNIKFEEGSSTCTIVSDSFYAGCIAGYADTNYDIIVKKFYAIGEGIEVFIVHSNKIDIIYEGYDNE